MPKTPVPNVLLNEHEVIIFTLTEEEMASFDNGREIDQFAKDIAARIGRIESPQEFSHFESRDRKITVFTARRRGSY